LTVFPKLDAAEDKSFLGCPPVEGYITLMKKKKKNKCITYHPSIHPYHPSILHGTLGGAGSLWPLFASSQPLPLKFIN
jgi:hypothetical protein